MPVDRGKPQLFHRATESTIVNPEVQGGIFSRAMSATGYAGLSGKG